MKYNFEEHIIHSLSLHFFHIQCLQKTMNEIYMDKNFSSLESYYGTNCVNATNIPCWIPHIKDQIDTQNQLNKCRTVMDLNCELMVLYSGLEVRRTTCTKPCQSWKYILNSRRTNLNKNRLKEVCRHACSYPGVCCVK